MGWRPAEVDEVRAIAVNEVLISTSMSLQKGLKVSKVEDEKNLEQRAPKNESKVVLVGPSILRWLVASVPSSHIQYDPQSLETIR
jgi:hypothetical protein